jgi:hypothetical protein
VPDAEFTGSRAVLTIPGDLCSALGLAFAVVIAALDLAAGLTFLLRPLDGAIERPGARLVLSNAGMPWRPWVAAHLAYLLRLVVLGSVGRRLIPQPLRQLIRWDENDRVRLALGGFGVVDGRIALNVRDVRMVR